MRFLVAGLLVSASLVACVDGADEGAIDITPGAGKADGATLQEIELTPERPAARFTVLCNEVINCDLELALLYGPEDTKVTVSTLYSDLRWELSPRAFECLHDGRVVTEHRLATADHVFPTNARCVDVPRARVKSSNAKEAFEIEVRKDEWHGERAVKMELSASWW
jgi:hypothetical protein